MDAAETGDVTIFLKEQNLFFSGYSKAGHERADEVLETKRTLSTLPSLRTLVRIFQDPLKILTPG
jgi:hypothetical protein